MNYHRFVFVSATVLLFTACIPWVSVPSRVELAALSGSVSGSPSGDNAATGVRFRGAICPLGAANSLHDRDFDVGLGYLYEGYSTVGENRFGHHGFFSEASYYLFRSSDSGPMWRLAALGSADVLVTSFEDDARTGLGTTAGLLWEYSNVVGGYGISGSDGIGAVGGGYGEWGLGVSLTGSYAHLDGRAYAAVLLGMSLRLPFGAGAVIVSR